MVTHYYLLLPVTLAAVLLSRVINHRLHGEAFMKYIYIGLSVIGSLLLIQSNSGSLSDNLKKNDLVIRHRSFQGIITKANWCDESRATHGDIDNIAEWCSPAYAKVPAGATL